jgi:hypothetical protein
MSDEVTVERISISPNNCLLDEPITLEMDFTAPRELLKGTWRMRVRASQRCLFGTLAPASHFLVLLTPPSFVCTVYC